MVWLLNDVLFMWLQLFRIGKQHAGKFFFIIFFIFFICQLQLG